MRGGGAKQVRDVHDRILGGGTVTFSVAFQPVGDRGYDPFRGDVIDLGQREEALERDLALASLVGGNRGGLEPATRANGHLTKGERPPHSDLPQYLASGGREVILISDVSVYSL